MAFNMNQFRQTQSVGELDLRIGQNPSVYSVRFDPDSAETDVTPGTGVLLVDGGANDPGGVPLVDVRDADGDAIFGVVLYSTKINSYAAGDTVEVAGSGAVVVFEASAAVDRGAEVALVLAEPGQVVTATTETVLGVALDKAGASGDLIRVRLS